MEIAKTIRFLCLSQPPRFLYLLHCDGDVIAPLALRGLFLLFFLLSLERFEGMRREQ